MRGLLLLCVLLSIVQSGLCCGKGRKKGKGGQPGPQPEEGDVIERLLGKDITTEPYEGEDDNAGDCDQLKCNLDDKAKCCWDNAVPPADELNFVSASGDPESEKLDKNFGTSTKPSGKYFITASEKAGTSDQSAQLYSCPITCAQGDITVKAKHWQTKGTKVQVCTEKDPGGPPENCQDLPGGSGKEDSVTLPSGENQRIVIQAKGFSSEAGDIALVDDIEVQCDPCTTPAEETTTTAASTTTSAGETTTAAGKAPCKEITCTFEAGNPCSYEPASAGGNADKNWAVTKAIFMNRLTGVPTNSPDGQQFAACYTKKKGEKAILTTSGTFDRDYVLRYQYYKATEGLSLKACCNDESNCPQDAGKTVQTADYRAWKQASVTCPAGTKKVIFVCENQDGASEGACGIDNIQLIQKCSGDANTCSENAC